jgi:hypothetical protein
MTANPKWPWPAETDLDRARRIAVAYRQHLHTAAPRVCAGLDEMVVRWGETWVAPELVYTDPEQAITTAEAADLVGVTPEMVRHWARLPHPDDPTRMLLPRFKRRGRDMTYLVADVAAAPDVYRRSRHPRAVAR